MIRNTNCSKLGVRMISRCLLPHRNTYFHPKKLLGPSSSNLLVRRTAVTTGRPPLPPSPRRGPLPPKKSSPQSGNNNAPPSNKNALAAFYQRLNSRTPVSWTSLFIAAVTAATAVAYYQIERERRLEEALGKIVTSEYDQAWTPRPGYLAPRTFVPTPYGWFPVQDGFGAPGKPAIGGPWSLIDLEGNLVTEQSFRGKWLLLYFGFARCPDICPSEMRKVGQVMDVLKETHPKLHAQLVPVFVSVDPARDSLQALREYARDFHPSYVFLTGAPSQVQKMAKAYRVYMSKADVTDDGDYLVDHSIVIYFHDDTGDLADCFTQSMQVKDVIEKVVERMEKQQKELK